MVALWRPSASASLAACLPSSSRSCASWLARASFAAAAAASQFAASCSCAASSAASSATWPPPARARSAWSRKPAMKRWCLPKEKGTPAGVVYRARGPEWRRLGGPASCGLPWRPPLKACYEAMAIVYSTTSTTGQRSLESLNSGDRLGLDADIHGIRKELVGELNFRVMRWLNKVLTVNKPEKSRPQQFRV
eukprot:211605-Prorocentrum_minimum.AAC.2